MPYLILADRHSEIDRVELFDDAVTIGRSPECAVQVRDAMLSRQHCRVEPRADGRWVLIDLGSRNGTHLVVEEASASVLRHLLEDGDVVRIGRSRVCFRAGPFVPAPPDAQQPRRGARPADPHEALAGTVTGFVLEQDMEEDSRISGFPIPRPYAADPRSTDPRSPMSDRGGATTARLTLGTKMRSPSHRPMPQPKLAADGSGEESQALIEKPALDWSALPTPGRLHVDWHYLAVLASLFAAAVVVLVSLSVISSGW